MTGAAGPAQAAPAALSFRRSRNVKERTIGAVLFASAAASTLVTLGIVVVLLRETLVFFSQVSPAEFFLGTQWTPLFQNPRFGVLPLMAGSFIVAAGAAVLAVPVGLLSAIFLSDYAGPRLRGVLKPVLEILAGIPTVRPPGGHAVFIDARRLLPHIPPHQFPGQALVCELYLSGGIRSCEIGSVMFGKEEGGRFVPPRQDLVRLALPRRAYTQSHVDRIIEICAEVAGRAQDLRGMEMTYVPPFLRHFTARFRPLGAAGAESAGGGRGSGGNL